MIPGKKYKPEDLLAIAWRRKWIIALPLAVCAAAAFLYSRSLPNRYRSEATVLVIPSQVSDNYIRPTEADSLNQRIELMRRQILSRPRLELLIEEFNLYSAERKELLMDQIIEKMRSKDIGVTVAPARRREDPNHFRVSFENESPVTAVAVAERLASLFVRENTEGRNTQADVTIQFLQSQADESLRQLQQHESRLESFKRGNAGKLPGQVETNLQLMQGARLEIQALTEGINKDRERQAIVERTISEETQLGSFGIGNRGASDRSSQSAAQELVSLRAALDALLLRLRDDHPDVRVMRGRIAEMEKRAEAEALQQPMSQSASAASLSPAEVERQRRLSKLRGEYEMLDREIKAKQARIGRAQARLQEHEQRIQSAPALESQLSDLMRDYGTVQSSRENLLKKLQDAKLASNLQQRQVGEQFRIIDPARRPDFPRSPNRLRINVMGAGFGLALGLLLVALLEYRDTSLRSEEDVLIALSLPVLALVPTMRTEDDHRRRRKRFLLVGSSGAAVLVVSLVAVAWKLRLFASWGG